MASVWQAPDDIRRQIETLKDEFYPHLANASIWVLCSDGKAVRNNRVLVTTTSRCTKTEKLSSGHDFKITILVESWSLLPDSARTIALDEALARCGVKYVPAKVEINGKKEIVKDEWGRTIYTDEIDYDKEGQPRWKVNPPDAGVYFTLLMRRGEYNEDVENVLRALAGKPLKLPTAAEGGDLVTAEVA
jgi:hypothetical protein